MGAGQSTPASVTPPDYTLEFDISCRVPVEKVIDIIEEAGKAVLQIYESDDVGLELKGDASPLTKADLASNTIICRGLQLLAPHVPIISEENRQQEFALRQEYQYCWVVDPLDGTKEFVKRNGEFTIMIGLVQGDTPVMGVVHVPCTHKTYFAVQGRGAFLREGGSTTRISAAEYGINDKGLVVVGSASHNSPVTQEFISILDSPEFSTVGSSLKLLMVAEGKAHIYPRLAPTCEWDTAAADIIVREAGGAVLQAGTVSNRGEMLEDWRDVLVKEQPLVYNKENLLNPAFVVFGKRRTEPAS